MRKIIGSLFQSLDGVIQAPGGPEEAYLKQPKGRDEPGHACFVTIVLHCFELDVLNVAHV